VTQIPEAFSVEQLLSVDMRLQNMFFLNGNAKLIHFDLADKVDTIHPTSYNSCLDYCHNDAKPGERRP